MPILAVCPYCHEGKVRAPERALGLSATCPRCHSCFTIVPSAEPAPESAAERPAALETALTAAPTPGEVPAALTARPRPQAVAPLPPEPTPAPPSPPEPPPVEEAPPEPPFALGLALTSITLAGVSIALSQFPVYGRLATALGAGLGLVLGLGSLILAERKRWVPGAACGVNALGLLVAIALPGLLNLPPWWPAKVDDDSRTVKAVGYDGSPGVPAEWVDVSTASWQQGDVRVAATALTLGPVELVGPKEQKKWTGGKHLQVWLHVTNVGVARKVDFRGWDAKREGPAPRLSDPAGKALAASTFDAGWEPAGRRPPAALFPGKSADVLLVFEPPPPGADRLRLELPGSAFGGEENVRLLIPRSSIIDRSAP
jgi:hypothetical protein